MRFPHGLQARFAIALAAVLVVVVVVLALMWQRQRAMQDEVARLGRGARRTRCGTG